MAEVKFNKEQHWDDLYARRIASELSWYQRYPTLSMQLISEYGKGKDASIIDVGGGNSNLVNTLLETGYEHVTVLDISKNALEGKEKELGDRGKGIRFIHTDILDYKPDRKYDIWHDRAAFHFLIDEKEIQEYIRIAASGINKGGVLIVATFSEVGPEKCSGLPVHRYSQLDLEDLLRKYFTRIECMNTDHVSPREVLQNFTFCAFRRTGPEIKL